LATTELINSRKFGSAMEIITILSTFIEMCIRVIYFSIKEKQLMDMIESYSFLPGAL
jgi:hypothetical protein